MSRPIISTLEHVYGLEDYVCKWKKTLVVVSHDGDFLNNVCNEIIHLHDKKLHTYRGNYDVFERSFAQLRKEMIKKDEKLKKAKGAHKWHKWRDYTVEFCFPGPTKLTPPFLQLIDVSYGYTENEDFILSNVNFCIDMGARVVIMGLNGTGKSTLVKLLAKDLNPTKGEVRRNPKLDIRSYSQHFVVLKLDETPVQYLLRLHPDQEGYLSKQEAVRAKLGKFGLPSENHLTRIADLSGGQKARVVFTSISMYRPHILLLDEPTNHLDIESIDALADALDEYIGGVVLVSHNFRLISRICRDEEKSQIWVVDDGRVEEFDGSFEDYKDELVKEIRAQVDD